MARTWCPIPSCGLLTLINGGELREGAFAEPPAGPGPSAPPEGVLANLEDALRAYGKESGLGEVWLSPIDVVLSDTNVVQPDIFLQEPRTLSSPLLTEGMEYRFTFTKPGRYEYCCTLHPTMRAVVIVEEAEAMGGEQGQ